jgi:hypothetical protein
LKAANLHKSLQTLVGMLRLSNLRPEDCGATVAPASKPKAAQGGAELEQTELEPERLRLVKTAAEEKT